MSISQHNSPAKSSSKVGKPANAAFYSDEAESKEKGAEVDIGYVTFFPTQAQAPAPHEQAQGSPSKKDSTVKSGKAPTQLPNKLAGANNRDITARTTTPREDSVSEHSYGLRSDTTPTALGKEGHKQ